MAQIVIFFDAGCSLCIRFMKFVRRVMKGVKYDVKPLTTEKIREIDSWRVKVGKKEYYRGEAFLVLLAQKYRIMRWVSKRKLFIWISNKVYKLVSHKRVCAI